MFEAFTTDAEGLWLAWAASSVAAAAVTAICYNRLDGGVWRQLLRDEEGAAYTLSYVMSVPFYALLLCVVVETTLMLVAKMGTVHAAFAGARVAAVWDTSASPGSCRQRVNDAAVRTMVPFASGLAVAAGNSPSGSAAQKYLDAYRQYCQQVGAEPAYSRYLARKFAYAEQAVRCEMQRRSGESGAAWDEDLSVTVRYEYPFLLPGVGRLFGERGGDGQFKFLITTTAVLQNESPQNDRRQLGISYASP